MFGIGELMTPTHLIFVMAVALLIFGPQRLPEIGRGLGKGIREFKGSVASIDGDKTETETKAEKQNS